MSPRLSVPSAGTRSGPFSASPGSRKTPIICLISASEPFAMFLIPAIVSLASLGELSIWASAAAA